MLRHVLTGFLLLALFVGGLPAAAEDKPATSETMDEALAKELVSKAASVSDDLLRLIGRLGAQFSLDDMLAPEASAPMTVVAIVLGGKSLDERDFKFNRQTTPKAFFEAVSPTEVKAGRKVPKHPFASIVHTEYVHDVTVEVNGRTATGTVSFRAPDVFEGTLQFTAHQRGTAWEVLELRFAHSNIRTTLENGRWRLHVPKQATAPNPLLGKALTLPRVGTVGPLPAKDMRVIVSVTRDGWIRVPDRKEALSLVGLERYLAERSDDPRLREPDGSSKLNAVLDIDATIPWMVTQWLMQTGAHPRSKIYKISVGATTSDGSQRGVIETRLPKDRGLRLTNGFPKAFVKHKLKVFKRTGTGASDMRQLYAGLQKLNKLVRAGDVVKFEIVAPPPKGGAVPHGFIVQMLDVCLAAGAKDLIFEGAAMPRGGDLTTSAAALKEHIDAIRKRPGVPMIRLGNSRDWIGPVGGDAPAVPARGLLKTHWGITASQAYEVIEEEFEETEEVIEETEIRKEPEIGAPKMPKIEDEEILDDAPFQGPKDNAKIGIGGGAGGAFRGQGGRRTKQPATQDFDSAVDDGLRWLAAHQSPNGGWEAAGFGVWCDGRPISDATKRPEGKGKSLYDTGVTGLALQAFLGAGYTNRGKHPFAKVVSRGLRFLKNVQDPEGCFGPRSTQQYIYNHAMASIAMIEAYAMTESPIFKGSAQRALDFIKLARNPYFAWRYGIKPGDNDTSISGWMFLALNSAQLYIDHAVARSRPPGLTVDASAYDGLKAWLGKVTDPDFGRVGYVQRGTGSARPQEAVDDFPGDETEAMTAVAAFARIMMGEDWRTSRELKKGLALVASKQPTWNKPKGRLDMYAWHWGSLLMYQAGGKHWTSWRDALKAGVLSHHRQDGDYCDYKGSWDPSGPWGKDGGRVYSTAIMTLVFQSHYRYDRKFKTKKASPK